MMMTKKRKRITLVLALALSASCAFCGMLTKKTAAASSSPLTMLGASVRLDNNQGIRFTAKLNEEPSETSKYYVMIVPATWLSDATHNLNGAVNGDYYQHLIDKGLKAEDDPATPDVDERDFINMECIPADYDENDDGVNDCKVVRGTIAQVKYNNTNRQFFGVAYEEKADGTRVYADNQEKSVRSCTYVAGAALNSGDYASDETKMGYLNNMINNAYNRVVLGKNESDEQSKAVFALPEISAYNPVGTELDFYVNGINGLDLPEIEWNVEKPTGSKSIFDDKQKLVVFDEEGTVKVSTKVAGQDLVANVACGTYLETFDTADNIKVDNQFRASSTPGTWKESHTDSLGVTEYGVGMGSATLTNTDAAIAVRFNKTEVELNEMFNDPNFQSITFRVLINDNDENGNMKVHFFNVITKTVSENIWTNITLTKEDIFENATLLTEFGDKQGIIDGIAKNFDKDGCGYMKGKNGTSNRRLMIVPNNNATTLVARELYIADIECAFGQSAYIETFAANADNIKVDNQFRDSSTPGTWLESFTDEIGITEYGVGMGSTTWTGSNGSIALRFNKTEAELKEMLGDPRFESITFRVLIKDGDASGDMTIKFFDLIERNIPENQWTNVTLTKEALFENETLLAEFGDKQGIIDGIAKNFDKDGCGYMKGKNGTTNRRLTYVPNNNATTPVAREFYVADIECALGEDTYLETYSASANNIRSGGQYSTSNSATGEYLDSYTDMNGVTEYGIGKTTYKDGRMCVRFDKTEDELRAILNNPNFEKITFRMLVKATGKSDGDSIAFKFLNTVDKTVGANQWVDVDLTKEEILNNTLIAAFGSEEKIIDSANGSLYGFVNGFSSSGIGYIQLSSASGNAAYRMIHTTNIAGLEVYIDHVSYTLASAN